jgi:predicted AAA+ superfamily ATPase
MRFAQIRGKIDQVTLDDPVSLEMAQDEGGRFFQEHKPPVFIDEIQYAPNLFSYIKMIVDSQKTNGLFFMSGSQQFSLMKDLSESLAGRVGIVDILGLSLREIGNDPFSEPFRPDAAYLAARKKRPPLWYFDKIWEIIWRGTMPKLYADPRFPVHSFYAAYLRTYIERGRAEPYQHR